MLREKDGERDLGSLEIRRRRLSEQVVEHVQMLVVRGELRPGDKLPSEQRLGQQFGVSRTVIREAIRSLHEWGWLNVIPGSGAYVTTVGPGAISQSIGQYARSYPNAFRDLVEVRKILEVEIAGLAAERATEADIQELEPALLTMKQALPEIHEGSDGLRDFVKADALFHSILARASTNALLVAISSSISDAVQEFSSRASLVPGMAGKAVSSHERIFQHVRHHDQEACREEMQSHMDDAYRLAESMSREQPGAHETAMGS